MAALHLAFVDSSAQSSWTALDFLLTLLLSLPCEGSVPGASRDSTPLAPWMVSVLDVVVPTVQQMLETFTASLVEVEVCGTATP
mgnify:CR=1 FL=1